MAREAISSWTYEAGGRIVIDGGRRTIQVHPNVPRWIVAANMARRRNMQGRADRAFVLSITDRCNIRCDFCCHPHMNSAFTTDDAVRMVEEACHLPFDEICVTGGEPYTRRKLVYLLAGICRSNGRLFGSITNGYWAKDRARAFELAEEMVEAGVARVTVSWDPSHGEFVHPETAQNCVEACMEAGIRTCLTGSFKKAGDRHANYGIDVSKYEQYANFNLLAFDVAPAGRAKELDDLPAPESGVSAPLVCPGRYAQELVVYARDGLVQPCCSMYAGYDMPELRVGDWRRQSVQSLLHAQQGDGYYRVLVDGGFYLLQKILNNRAPELAQRLPSTTGIYDICHLCERIMTSPDAPEIRRICDEYLTDRLTESMMNQPDALELALEEIRS